MAIAPVEATLRSIFGRAMPPHERLAFGMNAGDVSPSPETIRLVASWKTSLARSPEAVARAMETLGFDDAILARMMSPVTLENDDPLPGWAVIIERALNEDNSRAFEPEDGVLAPFMAVARQDLHQTSGRLEIAPEDGAKRDLLETLRVRLWRAVSPTLEHEQQVLDATMHLFAPAGEASRIDGSVRGWISRLETYPVLAYLIGTVIHHWRSVSDEFLARVNADAALLSHELFGGSPVHTIVSIQGDAGDLHNGGRSVAILTFESGHRVVYKPKDLSVAVAYMDLVERLNQLGLFLDLPTRTVLPRGDYSWEEYIAPAGCPDAAAVERFYVRMGETIRLFQMLEARDFWLDNLIAAGEHPQFVDQEMLVQPRMAAPSSLSPAERETLDALEETAHRTAAVGMPMPIAQGAPAEELGALAGPGPFASPFRFDISALTKGMDLPRLTAEGYVLWDHPEHVPHIDGDYAESGNHLSDVITGYRAMQGFLVANKDAVLDAVQAFRDVPVRYIYRDTWTCLKILQHSVHPGLLTDAAYREIFLSRLYAPVIDAGVGGAGMTHVVQSEIESLRGLDVPFFQSTPMSSDLLTSDGRVIEGYFPDTAFGRLEERVIALDQFPLDSQIDALLSSFACGRQIEPIHRVPVQELASNAPVAADYLDLAADLAADILETSYGDGRAWLGLIYHPPLDCGGFDVIRPDLLTGTTGLSVLFADLFQCTGDARWRDAARHALDATLSAWEEWEQHPAGQMHHGGTVTGAFYGSGSWLYGAARVADALGDDQLRLVVHDRAAQMIQQIRIDDLLHAGDVVDGPVGLLLAAQSASPGLLDSSALAARLVEVLGEGSTPPRSPHRKPHHALSSLPRGKAGVALALVRLLERISNSDADVARKALSRWANDTLARTPVSTLEPGTIAVVATIGQAGVPVDEWQDAVLQWLRAHARSHDTYRLLDTVEIALLMDTDGDARRHGEAAMQRLLRIREVTGTWFPGTAAADQHNLSLIWGVPAVAHALVRWSHPGALRSIRLVI